MLTTGPHATLRAGSSIDRSHFVAQKSVLKLDHARIREQKRWIIAWHQRAARYDFVTAVGEELKEFLANFCAFHNLYLSTKVPARGWHEFADQAAIKGEEV